MITRTGANSLNCRVVSENSDYVIKVEGKEAIAASTSLVNGQVKLLLQSPDAISVENETMIPQVFGRTGIASLIINADGSYTKEFEATIDSDAAPLSDPNTEETSSNLGTLTSEEVVLNVDNEATEIIPANSIVSFNTALGEFSIFPYADATGSNKKLKAFCHPTPNESNYLFAEEFSSYNQIELLSVVNEAIQWEREIIIFGNIFDQFLLSEDGKQTIIALTFTGKVVFSDEVFESVGGKDILLLFIDSDGKLYRTEQFGTAGDEEVKEAQLHGELLVFGGNYSGVLPERKIGELKFLQPSYDLGNGGFEHLDIQRPYVSYLMTQAPNNFRVLNVDNPPIQKQTFTVFPNPAQRSNVGYFIPENLNLNQNLTLEVITPLGQIMKSWKVEHLGRGTIDLSNLPALVVYLTLRSDGKAISSEKLILQ